MLTFLPALPPISAIVTESSPDLLGKNYFQTREKLGSAIKSLAQLGKEAGIDPGRIGLLENLIANLEDPFLFVVVLHARF